jgi:hypothetical protein
MKFRLAESVSTEYIFRGTGFNLNPGDNYYSGKFFADNPTDAANYGDTIEVFSVVDDTKIFTGDSSIDYCEQNGLMDEEIGIVSILSKGKFSTVRSAVDFYIYNGESPEIGFAISQSVAKDSLQSRGYSGADWSDEDDLIPHQYQIWDMSILSLKEIVDYDTAVNKYE